MVNYQNGKIYKLVSFQTDKIYIGSTCEKLSVRKAKHVRNYKDFLESKYHYTTSFELVKLGDVDIVLIEECPCENKEQLHKRERYYIESVNNCVNKHIPTRTDKEYYEDNKDEILKKTKEWIKKNWEKVKEQRKDYRNQNADKIKGYYEKNKEQERMKKKTIYTCLCGRKVQTGGKARHERTKKHVNALQTQ
jgi:hypothetical protein